MYYIKGTQENDDVSLEYGRRVQNALFEGAGLDEIPTYVNYAHGDEEVSQMYGKPWRVQKLRELKRRYDPNGRFNFYNPVV
jgi:FAD/FMN-containing dehydrogenase